MPSLCLNFASHGGRLLSWILAGLMLIPMGANAEDLPPEWTAWLAVVEKHEGSIRSDFVASSPEARAFDVWLASASRGEIQNFGKNLRERIFFRQRSDSYNIDLIRQRTYWARAAFSVSSSVKLEDTARRYLVSPSTSSSMNPFSDSGLHLSQMLDVVMDHVAETKFSLSLFFDIFFDHMHWRNAGFWRGALAEILLAPTEILKHFPQVSGGVDRASDREVVRWKVRLLRREWKEVDADLIVPVLKKLVASNLEPQMEDFLVNEVLTRRDLISRSEWKYWVWSMLEPLLKMSKVSPTMRERAEKIIGLLRIPETVKHVALLERLLRRRDRSVDPFIESEILSVPPFLNHPLLIKFCNGSAPTVTRLRYSFAMGESTNLWSESPVRVCQAHLRKATLRGARRWGVHPVDIVNFFTR